MANVALKSLKFPGLDDTYTIPQIDNTLSTAGKAADAKKTGDEISDLKSDISVDATVSTGWNQGYINNSTGGIGNDPQSCVTDYIKSNGYEYFLTVGDEYSTKVALYNSSKTFVELVSALSSGNKSFRVAKGNFVRVQVTSSASLSPSSITDSIIKIEEKTYTDKTLSLSGKAADAKVTGDLNKEQMTRKTLSGTVSLFDDHDGYLYWGGWANPSLFTENLPDNSSIYTISHFLSFGSGDYSRGVIAVQREPLALGVFSKSSESGTLRAGTAKLTPWRKSIAFFGDSIMWGRDGDLDVVTQVSKTIPLYCGMNLGCRSMNKGVGSQGWIAEGGGRNALEELQAYSNLSTEDIIVLCWGVNDLHDYDVGDWQNPASDTIMYQVGLCIDYIYSVNPTAIVVIVAPWNSPSYGSAPKYKYGTDKWQTMESAEKNYCEYWGIPFISQADSPFNGKNMMAFFSTITTDLVHPTQVGYEKLGNWLAAKLSMVI